MCQFLVPLIRSQQIGLSLIVKIERGLAQIELLPPQPIKQRLNQFPLTLRQCRRLIVPPAVSGNKGPHRRRQILGNGILHMVEGLLEVHLRGATSDSASA